MTIRISGTYLAVAVGLVCLASGYAIFSRTSSVPQDTLVVEPSTYASQVSIAGLVQAAQDVDLGFAQSGRISHVYIAVGDTASEGEVIAEIENGDVRASLAQAQATLSNAQAQLASLEAGTRPEAIAVSNAQVESDKTALAQANLALLDALQSAYTLADNTLHNTIDRFFNNPNSSQPTITFTSSDLQQKLNVESERQSIGTALSEWKNSLSALSVSGDLLSAASLASDNLFRLGTLLADSNTLLQGAVISGNASTINSYIGDVNAARGAESAAAAALTSAVSAQRAAASLLEKDQSSLALAQSGPTADELAAQQASVAAAQASVDNVRAQLAKTQVVAPFSGIITKMDAKVGEVVSPNVSEISMNSQGKFQIVAYIPEVEIAGVAVGNAASTTLDAYGPSTLFAAHVIAIDPAETIVGGVSTYKTTLQFDSADPRIRSGMTAQVVITTALAQGAIVVPQSAVFRRGTDTSYVQVVRGGSVVDVQVQLGAGSSVGSVQVLSGLSAGDSVVLSPDTAI